MKMAQLLIDAGCLQLRPQEPFLYASGLKGPIYCDNRLLLSDVLRRRQVVAEFSRLIEKKERPDAIIGVATAGIAHAAFLVQSEELPMLYIRAENKSHGRQNRLEGNSSAVKKVVVLEDLINQGGSLSDAVVGVREAGLDVLYCLSIVDYQMKDAAQKFTDLNVPVYSLTTFSKIIDYALDSGLIDQTGHQLLVDWQRDPKGWGDKS